MLEIVSSRETVTFKAILLDAAGGDAALVVSERVSSDRGGL